MEFSSDKAVVALQSSAIHDVDQILSAAQYQQRQLASLQMAISTFLRRDARLGQLRERTLVLRSRAKFEWKTCHDYRRFVEQSQQAFNDEAAAFVPQSVSEGHEERITRLRRLHRQLIQDFNAQDTYADRANQLQTELGDLEQKLQTRESSVKEAVIMAKQILSDLKLPAYSSATTAVETEVPPSLSTQPSDDLDPLIDRYFQKLGILNKLLEESVEIEVAYAEARAEREFKIEHDQALESTEDTFEQNWCDRRTTITQQILEARTVADRARKVCHDDGLDPEKYRLRMRRESDRSISDSMPEEMSQDFPLADDIPMLEEGGDVDARWPSEDHDGGFRVLTPGTFITRTSHELQPSDIIPPPLNSRVLDWLEDVDEQDRMRQHPPNERCSIPARRSLHNPMAPDFRCFVRSTHSIPPAIVMDHHSDRSGGAVKQDQPRYSALQRRACSDSNLTELLFHHDPNPNFMRRLKRFASGRT